MAKSNDGRGRHFSADLVGLEGGECTIPKCTAKGRTRSTGWFELGSPFGAGWLLEFNCPDHGPGMAYDPAYDDIVQRAVDELKP